MSAVVFTRTATIRGALLDFIESGRSGIGEIWDVTKKGLCKSLCNGSNYNCEYLNAVWKCWMAKMTIEGYKGWKRLRAGPAAYTN